MDEVYGEMTIEEQQDIHDAIMKLLEERACTVRNADMILSKVSRTIKATASVRFVGRFPYEF